MQVSRFDVDAFGDKDQYVSGTADAVVDLGCICWVSNAANYSVFPEDPISR